uniref:Uncharacterized protein n=1 Tax=Globisporangium ultimum (strain ATCC 200006 / CBS 805.95 / DAOM BR144) TaxID=431595 RepID=K3X7M5_GLOUD
MDAMVLADTCTDVNIIGGSTEQSIKGKVANVVFATNLLSNNTFVTNVKIANLNLETSVTAIAGMLPAARISELTLRNTLLPSFPGKLSTLTQLLALSLDLNYITEVTADDSIDFLLE